MEKIKLFEGELKLMELLWENESLQTLWVTIIRTEGL